MEYNICKEGETSDLGEFGRSVQGENINIKIEPRDVQQYDGNLYDESIDIKLEEPSYDEYEESTYVKNINDTKENPEIGEYQEGIQTENLDVKMETADVWECIPEEVNCVTEQKRGDNQMFIKKETAGIYRSPQGGDGYFTNMKVSQCCCVAFN